MREHETEITLTLDEKRKKGKVIQDGLYVKNDLNYLKFNFITVESFS